MPRWLSRSQFHELADEANTLPPEGGDAGFSVSAKQGPTGGIQRVNDAYMVGGAVPTVTHDAPVLGRQIAHFARGNRTSLAQSDMHLGAWQERGRQPTKQVDLDISQSFSPRTPTSEVEARHATLNRDERAYGEVKPDDYDTHINPFSTQRLSDEHGVEAHLAALRSDPEAYRAVVSGNVIGAMASWASAPRRRTS